MTDMDNILKARELTTSFNSNQWSRMTMQRRDPSIVSSHTPTFKQAIAAIELAYPNSTWEEACFLVKTNTDAPSTCEYCDGPVPFRPGNAKAPYKKFCCNECKVLAQANPAAEAVTINGVFYRDFTHAMEATGESRFNIREKIFDSSIPEYKWADNHDQKCIDKLTKQSPLLVDTALLQQWANDKRSFTSIEEEYGLSRGNISTAYSFFQIKHTYDQVNAEAAAIRDSKETLESMYATMTTDEIAIKIGVTPKAVQNWIRSHGIEMDYSRSQSKIERDMLEYIKTINPTLCVEDRNKTAIGLELDIYIPEMKVAFEFNGLFYHSTTPTDRSQTKRHSVKRDLCFREGITLLQFIDVGQTSSSAKLDIVKSMISNKINGNNITKLFARNTIVKIVPKQDAITFFNENHISGYRGCKIVYGLYHNDELVSCMSFGSPIANKKYDWEIVRFATRKFTRVLGGASKLFSHFTRNNTGSVLSYVDCQHGNGETYKKIGMKFVHKTGPGYIYTDMKTTYSRYEFQFPSIMKHCKNYDDTLTEFQNAENNGYTIYWNAGNLVYEYIPQR